MRNVAAVLIRVRRYGDNYRQSATKRACIHCTCHTSPTEIETFYGANQVWLFENADVRSKLKLSECYGDVRQLSLSLIPAERPEHTLPLIHSRVTTNPIVEFRDL